MFDLTNFGLGLEGVLISDLILLYLPWYMRCEILYVLCSKKIMLSNSVKDMQYKVSNGQLWNFLDLQWKL